MTVSVFLVNSEFLILHYSLFIDKSCTTCLFISKSFKELFFTAFFRKADAKVRLIFELPKLFRSFFSKSFFWSGSSSPQSLSAFQLICVSLSKADAKLLLYNISAKHCCILFCKFLAKSLICRTVGGLSFWTELEGGNLVHLNIITRARIYAYTYNFAHEPFTLFTFRWNGGFSAFFIIAILNEAKNHVHIKQWTLPRSFLPTVVRMTKRGNEWHFQGYGEGGEGLKHKLPCI